MGQIFSTEIIEPNHFFKAQVAAAIKEIQDHLLKHYDATGRHKQLPITFLPEGARKPYQEALNYFNMRGWHSLYDELRSSGVGPAYGIVISHRPLADEWREQLRKARGIHRRYK